MRTLISRKNLLSLAISALFLNTSVTLAAEIFNNPNQDFVRLDSGLNLGGGHSLLVAQNVNLGNNPINIQINQQNDSDGYSGSLTINAGGVYQQVD